VGVHFVKGSAAWDA
jgi:hypothetical protein